MQFIKSLTGTALILFTSSALATLITFDDLPERYPPNWQDHPDYGTDFEIVRPMPVTNQYDHLGVNFGSGDLDDIVVGSGNPGGAAISRSEDAAVSPPQAIFDFYGPGMVFTFIGDELPNYVSFYVTGVDGVGILATAWDDTGAIVADLRSDGWWGLPEWSTPAVPQQLMEIEGQNIQKIYVGNFYDQRGMTYLDNLYFGDARPIPEAATWSLLLTGLLGIIVRRRRA